MASARNKLSALFAVTEKPPLIHLDPVHLIQEIKKHPVIFDLDMSERNQFTIFGAWENVIASLIPCFRFLEESDKTIIRRNLRKRWTSMRKALTDDIARKRPNARMQVKWMREVQFMVPLIIDRRRRRQINKNSQAVEQGKLSPATSAASSPCSSTTYSEFAPSPTSTQYDGQNQAAIEDLHQVMVQTFITAFTPSRYHSQIDPDKNFLFGLLQIVRKIQPRQKEELKKKIRSFFPKEI